MFLFLKILILFIICLVFHEFLNTPMVSNLLAEDGSNSSQKFRLCRTGYVVPA